MRLILAFILISFQLSAQKDIDSLLQQFESQTPLINSYSAKTKMNDSLIYFLDTREKKEYNVSHISGAIYVGYNQFTMRNLKNIPKNAEIIVYCSLGYRSDEVGQKLKKAGYKNVSNLLGGIFQWSNKSYPLVNSNGEPTKKIHGYNKSWSQYINKGIIVY